jgi:hypothetical protein
MRDSPQPDVTISNRGSSRILKMFNVRIPRMLKFLRSKTTTMERFQRIMEMGHWYLRDINIGVAVIAWIYNFLGFTTNIHCTHVNP